MEITAITLIIIVVKVINNDWGDRNGRQRSEKSKCVRSAVTLTAPTPLRARRREELECFSGRMTINPMFDFTSLNDACIPIEIDSGALKPRQSNNAASNFHRSGRTYGTTPLRAWRYLASNFNHVRYQCRAHKPLQSLCDSSSNSFVTCRLFLFHLDTFIPFVVVAFASPISCARCNLPRTETIQHTHTVVSETLCILDLSSHWSICW